VSPDTLKALAEVGRRAAPFVPNVGDSADVVAIAEALNTEIEGEYSAFFLQGVGHGVRLALGDDLGAAVIAALFGIGHPDAKLGRGVSRAVASKWIVKIRARLNWAPQFPANARAGRTPKPKAGKLPGQNPQ
jgi:hypothetical protein